MTTQKPISRVILSKTHERSYKAYQSSLEKHASLSTEEERTAAEALFADDPMAWSGETLTSDSFTMNLAPDDVDEITQAVEAFAKSGASIHHVSRQTVPLLGLASRLQQIRQQLHSFPGIVSIRGLRPQTRESRTNIITLAAVSAHLSEQRGRQVGARYVVHIKDLSRSGQDIARVAPYSSNHVPFHTDRGDLVSMYVLSGAEGPGGEGTFASVAEVVRRVARQAPRVVQELMAPLWPFDTYELAEFLLFSQIKLTSGRPRPGNLASTYYRPLLFVQNGIAEMNFSRASLVDWTALQKLPNHAYMSAEQCEAMEWIQWTGAECGIKIQYQEGDLVVFNNRRILHGREAFSELDPTSPEARHILRLWLKDTPMAGLPPSPLQENYSKIFRPPYAIGGAGESIDWPLEPFMSFR